jgi:hypothetical protein
MSSLALKDVEDHDREGKCVVNFSVSAPVRSRKEYQKEWFREYREFQHRPALRLPFLFLSFFSQCEIAGVLQGLF